MSAPIEDYQFRKPDDIRQFRNSVRNIIDHPLGERRAQIKEALNELFPELERWDEEDVKAKIQKAQEAKDAKKRQAPDTDLPDPEASAAPKKLSQG